MIFQYFKKWQEEHQKKYPVDPNLPQKWEEHKKAQDASDKKPEPVQLRNTMPEPKTEEVVEQKPKEKKKEVKAPQQMIDISTYNGDTTDRYKWSQQFNEVLIQVDLPKGTRARDLEVVIATQ